MIKKQWEGKEGSELEKPYKNEGEVRKAGDKW